jgi:hypothetical protein
VVPSGINAVAQRLTPITVFALRKDGFDGEIALSFKDDPGGVSMAGGLVPAGQDSVRVTLEFAPWLAGEPVSLCLEGHATIGGKQVVRRAVPADAMMQAFAYKHLVPAPELTLLLRGNPRKRPAEPRAFRAMRKLLVKQPIRIPVGGDAEVRARMRWGMGGSETQLELSDPPEGIVINKASYSNWTASIVLHCDAEKAKPGLKGNLIVNGFKYWTKTNEDGKVLESGRMILGPLPAIPFEVVKR